MHSITDPDGQLPTQGVPASICKIKDPQSALLSNHEVLLHMQAEAAEYSGTDGTGRKRETPQGLTHVLRDTIIYLTHPDNPLTGLPDKHPDRPMTLYKGPHSLFRALAPKYRLNKAEYLQLYNLQVRTQVMLELVIEEAGSRFSEKQLQDMLGIIRGVFDEDEADIPEGVEDQVMERLPKKRLMATKKRKNTKSKGPSKK